VNSLKLTNVLHEYKLTTMWKTISDIIHWCMQSH
jgi:hypothetical protein